MPKKSVYHQTRLNLKALRINSGLSQENIALKFKNAQNTCSKQEPDQTKMDIETVIELARVFNIDSEVFMAIVIGDVITPSRKMLYANSNSHHF